MSDRTAAVPVAEKVAAPVDAEVLTPDAVPVAAEVDAPAPVAELVPAAVPVELIV